MTATPKSEPLVMFVTTDYAGITRGRSIAASGFARTGRKSLGWVPANMSLTPFDLIADPNPWGSAGDLRLVADPGARYRVALPGAATPFDIVMSDIAELDGRPWALCPRQFLKAALKEFEALTGLKFQATFEHEFRMLNTGWTPAPAFSLQAQRQAEPFGSDLMGALAAAGLDPEVFIPEYGKDQFEVTLAPAPGLASADRAVALREIVRELARLRGWRASFAPKTAEAGVGNGVHVHFSFLGPKGGNAAFDAKRPGRVSAVAGQFAAGILRHLPALTAFTAPSPVSYLRLQPHHWSSAYTWFGERERESSLRICPTHRAGGGNEAKGFNLEYRAADAAAAPHLVLGLIVKAGIEGIRLGLADPPLFTGDPERLSPEQREELGLKRLPKSLPEALGALEADATVKGWFAAVALETYLGMKRQELKLVEGLNNEALCARYAAVY